MLTYTFPYDFGQAIFIPSRFMGKVKDVDEYKVVGYEVAENVVFVVLHPKTYEGITTRRRINDPSLYTTEAEAWADKREKGASE